VYSEIEVPGPEELGQVGAGRAAAHVDAPDGAPLAEDDGAAGGGTAVRPVPDLDAGHIRDRVEALSLLPQRRTSAIK